MRRGAPPFRRCLDVPTSFCDGSGNGCAIGIDSGGDDCDCSSSGAEAEPTSRPDATTGDPSVPSDSTTYTESAAPFISDEMCC
eukprot:TsM_000104600 transcript=TsM_000104600 gene=TsM_000104600